MRNCYQIAQPSSSTITPCRLSVTTYSTLHIWRPLLHPSVDRAPCYGDRDRLIRACISYIMINDADTAHCLSSVINTPAAQFVKYKAPCINFDYCSFRSAVSISHSVARHGTERSLRNAELVNVWKEEATV